jgi:hypothetical protein
MSWRRLAPHRSGSGTVRRKSANGSEGQERSRRILVQTDPVVVDFRGEFFVNDREGDARGIHQSEFSVCQTVDIGSPETSVRRDGEKRSGRVSGSVLRDPSRRPRGDRAASLHLQQKEYL